MRLTPSDIVNLYRPTPCSLRVYLREKGVPGAEPSAFDQILQTLGQRHEEAHLATLGAYEDLSVVPQDERVRRTTDAIATQAVKEMEEVRDSVLRREFGSDHDLERNRLFAAEGQAASSYWHAARMLLWWKPGFEGRVRRGASDLVNSLLNYGYGILYSRCLNVLLRTGLNVYVGFLHKPQPGKAGLLYDFVEEFRAAAVDRTVFGLLNLGASVELETDGLSTETRQELARKVVHRLQAETRYHGESLPLEEVMGHQARLLVQHIEGKACYETFVLPW